MEKDLVMRLDRHRNGRIIRGMWFGVVRMASYFLLMLLGVLDMFQIITSRLFLNFKKCLKARKKSNYEISGVLPVIHRNVNRNLGIKIKLAP